MNNYIGTPKEISQYLWELDENKKYQLCEYKEKRSLSQNAYSWKLQNQIANEMRLSNEEVHFNMLKHYGQFEIISLLDEINCEDYFPYYEEIGKSELNGKIFKHIKVYKPTHKMNTKEMSIFIDGVVQEAKQLGIETLPKEEIERLSLL